MCNEILVRVVAAAQSPNEKRTNLNGSFRWKAKKKKNEMNSFAHQDRPPASVDSGSWVRNVRTFIGTTVVLFHKSNDS